MGRLIPKTHLKWNEPKVVRRTRDALAEEARSPWLRSPWFRLSMALLVAGLIMCKWFLARLNPQQAPLPLIWALPLSLVGGAFFVYVLPLLYRLCPSFIRVTDVGITRVIGNHAAQWKYRDIQSCRIASAGTGGEAIAVLEITTHQSKVTLLGIDPKVSLDDLQRVLVEHGVPVCSVNSDTTSRGRCHV